MCDLERFSKIQSHILISLLGNSSVKLRCLAAKRQLGIQWMRERMGLQPLLVLLHAQLQLHLLLLHRHHPQQRGVAGRGGERTEGVGGLQVQGMVDQGVDRLHQHHPHPQLQGLKFQGRG